MKVGFVLAILAGLVLSFAAEGFGYIIPYENAKEGKEIIVLHRFSKGDSLCRIAELYGTELNRIIEMNPSVHRVRKGECLSKIAKLYGVNLNKILKINKSISNKDKIYVGQKLNIPIIYPGRELKVPLGIFWDKVIEHEVKKGEYPLYIARKYAAFPEQIFHDNKLTSKDLIYPGQILKVATVRVPKKKVIASWYGPGFHGRKAANGEKFDMNGFDCGT